MCNVMKLLLTSNAGKCIENLKLVLSSTQNTDNSLKVILNVKDFGELCNATLSWL